MTDTTTEAAARLGDTVLSHDPALRAEIVHLVGGMTGRTVTPNDAARLLEAVQRHLLMNRARRRGSHVMRITGIIAAFFLMLAWPLAADLHPGLRHLFALISAVPVLALILEYD